MNWKLVFNKYKKYAEENLNTEVSIFFDDNYSKPFNESVDGCAYLDKNFSLIDIYTSSHDSYDTLLTVLIHEIGHVICFNKYGNNHTEEDAWIAGESILEKSEIPEYFYVLKMRALESYEHIAKFSD